MEGNEKDNRFLKGKLPETTFTQHHKDGLGLEVPQDYFHSSKANILDLVKEEVREKEPALKETKVFYLRRSFQVAASIAVLLILAIGFQLRNTPTQIYVASDDVLIESLFVEEESMNDFVEGLLMTEVVEGAEQSEQALENIFINSLFVEDTLLDIYTKKSLIVHIVL